VSNKAKTYDLVVIGGGPAGLIGATTAATFGRTVALINDHHELGGAGINTGTLPSKTLRETALALSGLRSRNLYGVDLSLRREVTVADLLRHEQNVKAGFNDMIAQRLAAQKIDFYSGLGIFQDPHKVQVHKAEPLPGSTPPVPDDEATMLYGEKVLIATGSSPLRPTLFSFDAAHIYDSDTILNLDRLSKTLAIVGAGIIGSEYAGTFAALGVQVHLIDGRGVLLPFLDAEVSQALSVAMERNGVVFHRNERVLECAVTSETGIALKLSSGALVTVDAVLVAAGRKSNTDKLNLAIAGVAVGDHGLIHVDEHYRTVVPHIYAVGDVIGFPALASTSMEQARRAVRHALELRVRTEIPRLLPTGIFTIPEVSMVGETEETLKKQGTDYVVGRALYENTVRGRIIGDTGGILKLLFRRADMKLLGVHVVGEYATELVHVGMMVMLAGLTDEIFDEACFNLPTLGELYKYAALDASRRSSQLSPGT
jgi:NAD(P) transhydrogenase